MATLGDGHAEPISRLLFPGSQLLASGDEGGVIRLWDTRQKKAIYKCAAAAPLSAHDRLLPLNSNPVACGASYAVAVRQPIGSLLGTSVNSLLTENAVNCWPAASHHERLL